MPAKNNTGHWAALPKIGGLLFSRGQFIVTPTARKATITQYWVSPKHEYCGFAAIRYCDDGSAAIIKLALLRAWQPGVTYAAPPLVKIKPIPTPIC